MKNAGNSNRQKKRKEIGEKVAENYDFGYFIFY